jgi:hypothetical protein
MNGVLGAILKDTQNLIVFQALDEVIRLVLVLHVVNNRNNIFRTVEIRDHAIVKDVIDVFNECFIDNLGVGHKEDMGLAVNTSCSKQIVYHIFAPIFHAIALDDLKLYHVVLRNESGQLGQTLTSRATHTNEQTVTILRRNDAMNLHDMLDSISEEDKIHRFRSVHRVELFKLGRTVLLDIITLDELTIDIGDRLPVCVSIWVDRGGERSE